MSGIHRQAARRDPGERAIVSALRQAGAMVWPVSAEGLPDLLVGHRGRWILLECKAPLGPEGGASENGQKLKPAQARFFADAELGELPAFVVRSPIEALQAIGFKIAKSRCVFNQPGACLNCSEVGEGCAMRRLEGK